MDSKTHSAFQRLMREADPTSSYNQKLVAAANKAADELCRHVIRVVSTARPTAKLTQRWFCGDNGWFVAGAVAGPREKLYLFYRRRDGFVYEYGGDLCEDPEWARFLARDIAAFVGGPQAWLEGRINFLCAEYGFKQ